MSWDRHLRHDPKVVGRSVMAWVPSRPAWLLCLQLPLPLGAARTGGADSSPGCAVPSARIRHDSDTAHCVFYTDAELH